MSSITVLTARPVSAATGSPEARPVRPGRGRRIALAVLLPALLLAPLLIPPAADARTIRTSNVYAYGDGDVNCYVVKYGGTGIECLSQGVPDSVGSPNAEGDGYVALRRTGRARVGVRSDFPGFSATRRKLRDGDTWRPGHSARGIVCALQRGDLKCINRSGHGFTITPSDYRRF